MRLFAEVLENVEKGGCGTRLRVPTRLRADSLTSGEGRSGVVRNAVKFLVGLIKMVHRFPIVASRDFTPCLDVIFLRQRTRIRGELGLPDATPDLSQPASDIGQRRRSVSLDGGIRFRRYGLTQC